MLTCHKDILHVAIATPTRHAKSFSRLKNRSACRWPPIRASSSDLPSRKGAVLILPGFLFGSAQYQGLATSLRRLGYAAEVLPMPATAWFPVLTGSDFEFYLRRMDTALTSLYKSHGRVALCAHSASGWVSRILLGDVPYQGTVYNRQHMVHTLLTLGSPHGSIEAYPLGRTPEKITLEGIKDAEIIPKGVRGSSLQFTNYFYPRGDIFPEVNIVCVAGDTIWGEEPPWRNGESTKGNTQNATTEEIIKPQSWSRQVATTMGAIAAGRSGAWLAYESYRSGCGHGDVTGDGVTPLCIAHLPGAENVTLQGIFHGPTSKPDKPWYGDEQGIQQWIKYLE